VRNAIIEQIYEEMKNDKDIFFLTADMGINLVEKIEKEYPDRFLNVGIAEQNLIGVASGLVNIGFKVIAYTISNFIVHRCLEQLRNDISLHKKPILLIGTSCGYDNSPLGPTHHVIDDWGYIKNLPNFNIFCPSNINYCDNLLKKLINKEQSIYLRIPKGKFDLINSQDDYEYLSKNNNNIFLTYGSLVQELFPLYEKYDQSLLIFNKLHPIDKNPIIKILEKYKKIYIVEDHFASNGLYDSICKICINSKLDSEIISLSPNDYELKVGTSINYFFKLNGIDLVSVIRLINKK
jgi:transketolase